MDFSVNMFLVVERETVCTGLAVFMQAVQLLLHVWMHVLDVHGV